MSGPASTSKSLYENSPEAAKLRETQQNVDEVVSIMHTNVKVAMEREGKLADIDERSKNLEQDCAHFKDATVKLRKKMWYKNLRMKFIIGGVVAVIVLLLLYSIFFDDD